MPHLRLGRRFLLRRTILAAVAAGAFPFAAIAKDLLPTPDGAKRLSANLGAYLGKPAAGAPPAIAVAVEGAHYAVSVDLAALTAPLKDSGFSIDPAVVKYALTEQDDGGWRVEGEQLPAIVARGKDGQIAYNFAGYNFTGVFDPALAAFRSSEFALDKFDAKFQSPKLQETIAGGPMRASQTAKAGSSGDAAASLHEDLADLSIAATQTPDPDKPDAKPVSFTFQLGKAAVDLDLDGAPLRKALDLWAFVVAHPGRAELAANEAAFKDLLRAVLPTTAKLSEKVDAQKISVSTEKGSFGFGGARFGLAAALAQGPKDSIEYRLGFDDMALPAGLVPPTMKDLVPTSVDVDVKASGFDFGAAAAEAINDLHLAGDGPAMAPPDSAKVFAMMKGTGPIAVELLPSHVVAPQVDLTLEGKARLEGAKASGTLKIHARNFDKTVAALKASGPMATPQVMGVLTLAKGLGKADGDGLTWIAEYDSGGALTINGLPFPIGK